MRAVMLLEPGKLKVGEAPVPRVAPDEVLLRVMATGICTTDIMVYQGRYTVPLPLILGHEAAGVVERVGARVTGLREGDRGTVEASWGCGACPACVQGEDGLCPARVSLGRTRDGTFAEYIAVPARAVHLLPPEVSFDQAQALVTVACAVRAIRRGRPGFGERVAVFGPGISGLIMAQLAGHNGASEVVVFGTRDWRLQLAQNLGATGAVNVRRETWREQAGELTGQQGFDLVFEATGNPEALSDALQVVRNGGRVVAFSLYDGPVDQFPAQMLYAKEVTLIGVRGGAGGYPLGIELARKGSLRIDPLISHRLPLSEAEKGFAFIEHRDEGVMRVVLSP
jgi:L-iditol 2-dehydrogenase